MHFRFDFDKTVQAAGVLLDADGDRIFVRRVCKYTSEDIHKVLFPNGPPPRRSIAEMDEAIGEYMRRKYARR